jgi:hypothetical protein
MQIFTDFKASAPTSRNWSGVFGYKPETETLVRRYGEMFAVMSIGSEVDFDLSKISGLLFDELQQSYFDDNIDKIDLNTFEKALIKVKSRIDMILEREEQLSQTGIDLEMAVAVIKEKILYAAVVGEAKVYISRENDFAEVSKALIDPQMDGFMRLGSLFVEANDRVFLATSRITNTNLDGNIKTAMKSLGIQDLVIPKGAGLLVGYEIDQAEIDKLKAMHVEEPVVEKHVHPDIPTTPELESTELEPALTPEVEIAGVDTETEVETDLHGLRTSEDEPMSGRDGEREMERMQERVPNAESDAYDEMYVEQPQGPSALAKLQAALAPALASGKVKAKELMTVGKAKAKALQQNIADRRQSAATARPEPEMTITEGPAHTTGPVPEMGRPLSEPARMPMASTGVSSKLPPQVGQTLTRVIAVIKQGLVAARNFWEVQVMGRGDRTQMYMRGRRPGPNWKLLSIIVVVCALVLFFGIRSVIQQREFQAKVESVNSQIKTLQNKLDTLNTQLATVSIGTGKETEKESLLNDFDDLSRQASNLKSQKISTDKLDQVIAQINTDKDQLLNVNAFTEPQVISDLGANFEGVDLSDITYSNGNVYVADKGRGVIYRLGTAIKSEATVFASSLVQPYLLDTDTKGDIVVIDNNTDSALATIDLKNGTVKRNPGLSKARLGTLAGIDIWASNSSMYSVKPEKQNIYRQDNVAGSYGIPNESSPWRNDPDFASATDMAADYWIYVMVKGKGLQRYLAGAPAPMTMTGLVSADVNALKNADAFEITDTRLYIVDNANKRILVFAKRQDDAQYFDFLQQYVYRGSGKTFTQIKDIVVNEASKKMYVLDGSQVLRIDLN